MPPPRLVLVLLIAPAVLLALVLGTVPASGRTIASPHHTTTPTTTTTSFRIEASAVEDAPIAVGLNVRVTIATPAPLANTAAPTVYWPFVNGTQWGAFVTCAASSTANCSLLLPLPLAGVMTVQLAVMSAGRQWCSSKAEGCFFPVGTPLPTAGVLALSNALSVPVAARQIVPPPGANASAACIDWEPWFTENNLGGAPWLSRPGAEGVPLVGLYSSFNALVVRMHALWLIEAGINCILVDWSNNLWSKTPWAQRGVAIQELINSTTFALDQYAQLRAEGLAVPQAIIMIGYKNGPPADPAALRDEVAWIEANYLAKYGAGSFVQLDGQPVLVVLDTADSTLPQLNLTTAFAVRYMATQLQEHPALSPAGWWSWMDGTLQPLPALRRDGSAEALTVTPGFFAQGGWLAPEARGVLGGSTFVFTMQSALAHKPSVLLVCQWNEFAGQPGGPSPGASFVDSYNLTLTNDMEPVSLSECAYTRPGDQGQLPRCNTGWGMAPLNLLRASLAVYRQARGDVPPATANTTVVRLASPQAGAVVPAGLLALEWALIGPGSSFSVAVDGGKPLATFQTSEHMHIVDLRGVAPGPHTLTLTVEDSSTAYALSKEQTDRPGASLGPAHDTVAVVVAPAAPLAAVDANRSEPVGFADLNSPGSYEYGASIIHEKGVYYAFYCSPGTGGGRWDAIRMTTSTDGLKWTAPTIALQPSTPWDANSTCDPSVVRMRGVYYLFHTCINVYNPPDGYKTNRICVAVSDSIQGPYHKVGKPVVANTACTDPKAYCAGQPSAVVRDSGGQEQLVLFYSSIGGPQDPTTGPNPGSILGMTADAELNFSPLASSQTLFAQHNVDVKWERSSQQFVAVQGDVGASQLTWTTSPDGVSWLPYVQGQRTLPTNPALPPSCASPCSNNNPGLAGLADGSFTDNTYFLYGSSYGADAWGDWHLFRNDLVVTNNTSAGGDCRACAPNGCDFLCSTGGQTMLGHCAVPGSTDPGHCCECQPFVQPTPCASCAPNGCVQACVGAGHAAGVCGSAAGPGDCCVCFDQSGARVSI